MLRSWPSSARAMAQPRLRSPTTLRPGIRTSVKNVSQKGDAPLMRRMGRTETPGVDMSSRMNVIPSCLRAFESVRTSRNIQSDLSPYEVQIFCPLTTSRRRRRRPASGGSRDRSPRSAPSSPGTSAPRPCTMGGRCSRLSTSEPSCNSSGPIIHRPKPMSGGRSESAAISSVRTFASCRGEAPASVLAGPRRRGPPSLGHDVAPPQDVGGVRGLLAAPAQLVGALGRRAHRWRRAGGQPPVGLLAKGVQIGHGAGAYPSDGR
jgi:hypothetical protein